MESKTEEESKGTKTRPLLMASTNKIIEDEFGNILMEVLVNGNMERRNVVMEEESHHISKPPHRVALVAKPQLKEGEELIETLNGANADNYYSISVIFPQNLP